MGHRQQTGEDTHTHTHTHTACQLCPCPRAGGASDRKTTDKCPGVVGDGAEVPCFLYEPCAHIHLYMVCVCLYVCVCVCAQKLGGEAAEAQEYLVKLPDRIRKLAERAQGKPCVLRS